MRVSAESSGQSPQRVDRGSLRGWEVSAAQLGSLSLPGKIHLPAVLGDSS